MESRKAFIIEMKSSFCGDLCGDLCSAIGEGSTGVRIASTAVSAP